MTSSDPDLMQENFEEMEYLDSTTTKLSDIVPKDGTRFRFQYDRSTGKLRVGDRSFDRAAAYHKSYPNS